MNDQNYNHILDTMREVLERTEETKDCVQKLDKKVDLHIQKTEMEFEQIRELDDKQNNLLEEHAKRSDRLEKDNALREEKLRLEYKEEDKKIHSDLDTRLQKIEKPRDWLKMTAKVIFWTASAAGAMYGAYEFFEFIKGIL